VTPANLIRGPSIKKIIIIQVTWQRRKEEKEAINSPNKRVSITDCEQDICMARASASWVPKHLSSYFWEVKLINLV
jgi:hypothetical protein